MDLPEGVHLVTEEEFHKLMNEDRSSKYRLMELNNHRKPLGLEFDIHPELCELAGIYPLPGYRSTPENYHWIVGMATAAANEYFGPDGIERPVTAIMDVYGCEYPDLRSSYYITFIVDNNGMEEFFQAEDSEIKEKGFLRPLKEKSNFEPVFHYGSCAEKGPKQYMKDEYILYR